jgi:hypothetical protein
VTFKFLTATQSGNQQNKRCNVITVRLTPENRRDLHCFILFINITKNLSSIFLNNLKYFFYLFAYHIEISRWRNKGGAERLQN